MNLGQLDFSCVGDPSYMEQEALVFTRWKECGHMHPTPSSEWSDLRTHRGRIESAFRQMLIPGLNWVTVYISGEGAVRHVEIRFKTNRWAAEMYRCEVRFELYDPAQIWQRRLWLPHCKKHRRSPVEGHVVLGISVWRHTMETNECKNIRTAISNVTKKCKHC